MKPHMISCKERPMGKLSVGKYMTLWLQFVHIHAARRRSHKVPSVTLFHTIVFARIGDLNVDVKRTFLFDTFLFGMSQST